MQKYAITVAENTVLTKGHSYLRGMSFVAKKDIFKCKQDFIATSKDGENFHLLLEDKNDTYYIVSKEYVVKIEKLGDIE